MTVIILRVQHPGGQLRIEVDSQETIGDLNKIIASKLSADSNNIILSFDNKKYVQFSPSTTIRSYKQFEDGARIFMKLKDQN